MQVTVRAFVGIAIKMKVLSNLRLKICVWVQLGEENENVLKVLWNIFHFFISLTISKMGDSLPFGEMRYAAGGKAPVPALPISNFSVILSSLEGTTELWIWISILSWNIVTCRSLCGWRWLVLPFSSLSSRFFTFWVIFSWNWIRFWLHLTVYMWNLKHVRRRVRWNISINVLWII